MVDFLSYGSEILAQIITKSIKSRILKRGFYLGENWARVLKATYLSLRLTFLFWLFYTNSMETEFQLKEMLLHWNMMRSVF